MRWHEAGTSAGQARHLVTTLSPDHGVDFVLLDCHGADGAVVLPEPSDSLERAQPFHGLLTAADLRGFARFDGATVISTGCETGVARLAESALACGAAGYVAPAGQPEGHASLFALSYVFYELAEGRSVGSAAERLRGPRLGAGHVALLRLSRPARDRRLF